jgi:hypothetical protein
MDEKKLIRFSFHRNEKHKNTKKDKINRKKILTKREVHAKIGNVADLRDRWKSREAKKTFKKSEKSIDSGKQICYTTIPAEKVGTIGL